MSLYTVPVVLVDIATGREHRFPTRKAAADFLGTNPGNVTKAALCDYQCHGYRVYREDEYEVKEP